MKFTKNRCRILYTETRLPVLVKVRLEDLYYYSDGSLDLHTWPYLNRDLFEKIQKFRTH